LADSLRGANWPGSEKARYRDVYWYGHNLKKHLAKKCWN